LSLLTNQPPNNHKKLLQLLLKPGCAYSFYWQIVPSPIHTLDLLLEVL